MTVKQLILILVTIVLCTAALIGFLRPELIPVKEFGAIIDSVVEFNPFAKDEVEQKSSAARDKVSKKNKVYTVETFPFDEQPPEGKKYLFQLEFISGNGTLAEKVQVKNGTLTYETSGGLAVTVPVNQLRSVQRVIVHQQVIKK